MSSMCHNDSGSGGEKHNLDHNILACILTYDHSSKITAIGLFNLLEAYQKAANVLKRIDTTQPEGISPLWSLLNHLLGLPREPGNQAIAITGLV